MNLLHIANTDFELELVEHNRLSLEDALRQSPVICQLQYLPQLYAPFEPFYVSDPADPPLLNTGCHLLTETNIPFQAVESWGASRRVAEWALNRGLNYKFPEWSVVKEVNSKQFSFGQGIKLDCAELIFHPNDLELWVKKNQAPLVLKTCYGFAGRGHLILPQSEAKIKQFTQSEWRFGRPIIAEPWVKREIDFSTQWILHENGTVEYQGATVLRSSSTGLYEGTLVGEEHTIFGPYFPYLKEHCSYALNTLKKMHKMGFFGNVGLDAMVYEKGILQPIVEINARKTMGWVALQIQKRLFSNQTIQVSYVPKKDLPPLLPQAVLDRSGKRKLFSRNLYVEVLDK